ncbi:MAG: DNA primase [Acholeplasmatales bacterium]|nr:MAG: DNA primase [Acholeplasmatales bacterium]
MDAPKANMLETVLHKTDIVDLINEVTPLQKQGDEHVGLCPFHHEKTPSFRVNEEKQVYYCFSCKASGNALTFVKEKQGLSTGEAIRFLAERAGIELSGTITERPNKSYTDLNAEAMKFFELQLHHTKPGIPAKQYLLARGFTEATLRHFNLGFAPREWRALYEALKRLDALDTDMTDLGLIYSQDEIRDVFRNRIMFPIHDDEGYVIGFSGRTYDAHDTQSAKYMNTTSTPVFDKGTVLYNLHRVRPHLKTAKRIVLFEGYVDVIQAYQAGVPEGIAIMGTALTPKHIQKIKRLTDTVILCLDGDKAGIEATNKFLDTLEAAKLKTFVSMLPEGLDPDDFIRQEGAEAFKKQLDDALDGNSYRYRLYHEAANLNKLTDVEHFKNKVFKMIAPLDGYNRTHFLKRLSEDLNVSIELIESDFREATKSFKTMPRYRQIAQVAVTDKFVKAERGLIHYFLRDRHYERKFRMEFRDAMFNDKHARDVQLEIFEFYRMNPHDLCIVPTLFLVRLNEAQRAYCKQHIEMEDYPFNEDEYEDFLAVMREQNRRAEIKLLKAKLNAATTIQEKIEYRKEIDDMISRGKKHGKRASRTSHSRVN